MMTSALVNIRLDAMFIGVFAARLTLMARLDAGQVIFPSSMMREGRLLEGVASDMLGPLRRTERRILALRPCGPSLGNTGGTGVLTLPNAYPVTSAELLQLGDYYPELRRFEIDPKRLDVRDSDGAWLALSEHARQQLGEALERIRVVSHPVLLAADFLGPQFTLRQVQEVAEAVLDRTFLKPSFRKSVLDSGYLEPTGEKETTGAHRPAELYRLNLAS